MFIPKNTDSTKINQLIKKIFFNACKYLKIKNTYVRK